MVKDIFQIRCIENRYYVIIEQRKDERETL